MATMDIIKLNGGQPANFLDVGGGATPQAIKQAFDLITSDPKVTAIFVNIFGGIVRCDAIAQGLISVVESMNLRTPIVARLQGTNMEVAHKLINDSGLKIFSVEDLQAAAEKSVQFSKVVKMGESFVPSFVPTPFPIPHPKLEMGRENHSRSVANGTSQLGPWT